MSYERLNMKNGDVINDYHINYLQDAISKIASEEKRFKERLASTLISKGLEASSTDTFDKLLSQIDSLPNSKVKEPETKWPDIRDGIESGHIRLLAKTGDTVKFYIKATKSAVAVVNWGDGDIKRYYIPPEGQWLSKSIVTSAGEHVEGEDYRVAKVDISLDIEDGAICEFKTPGESCRNNLLWFCAKDIVFTTGDRMFTNNAASPCVNLKYIDLIGGSIRGKLSNFANDCTSLERIDANFIPGATDVNSAFAACKKLKKPPVINLNDVINAIYLFKDCSSMTEFDYYINNNGSFSNTAYMFSGCTKLQGFVANQEFNFSKVTDQSHCFYNCSSLTKAPTIIFGNGSATNFFAGCANLVTVQHEIIANNLDSVGYFFAKCISLVNGPTDFSANNASNIGCLFEECTNLQSVPSIITFPKAVSAINLFKKCYRLKKAPTTISLPAATEIREMFAECSSLTTAPVTIEALAATDAKSLFKTCTVLNTAPTTINLPVAQDVKETFQNCSSLVTGPTKYYAPQAIAATGFFQGCTMLENAGTHFEIGNNVPGRCNFMSFFKSCKALVTLPTKGDMHKGLNYQEFFNETTNALTYDSLVGFCEKGLSFPHANTFQHMFYKSSVVKIPNIDAPQCMNTYAMFHSDSKTESIGDINIPLCNDVTMMFYNGGQSLLNIGELNLSSMVTNNGDFTQLKNIKSLTLTGLGTVFTLDNARSLSTVILKEPKAELIGNLSFQNCNMNGEALNNLLDSLPDRNKESVQLTINIKGNPGVGDCDTEKGTSKNWIVTTT